jgi:formylglycine-generating enzyme required for sulfatase activity
MGSEEGEDDEKPVHNVKITKAFYIGIYEVTQEQYEKIMGENPSKYKDTGLPVEMVVYSDAEKFCEKLSEKESKTYRLPTEAEWEYSCRAGSKTKYYWGDKFDGKYAWCGENSDRKTHIVGAREPNDWGLYDMSGNVWEWCQDWYKHGYPSGEQVDPKGPRRSIYRVTRSGSWILVSKHCRSSVRGGGNPVSKRGDFGFRVVMEIERK